METMAEVAFKGEGFINYDDRIHKNVRLQPCPSPPQFKNCPTSPRLHSFPR